MPALGRRRRAWRDNVYFSPEQDAILVPSAEFAQEDALRKEEIG